MSRSPLCPSSLIDYRIEQDVYIKVGPFFREKRAVDWRFTEYHSWKLSHSTNVKFNTLLHDFQSDLTRIRDCEQIPNDIRSYAGAMLKYSKATNKRDFLPPNTTTATTSQHIYHNSIVGCSGDSINLSVFGDQSAQQENVDSNDGERSGSIVQATKRRFEHDLDEQRDSTGEPTETALGLDDDDEQNDNSAKPAGRAFELDNDGGGDTNLRFLYDYAYDLYQGNMTTISELSTIPATSVLSRIYNGCVEMMKRFGDLDRLDTSLLNVLLSGIINTINMEHRPTLEKYLTRPIIQDILTKHKLDAFDKFADTVMTKLVMELKESYADNAITGLRRLIYQKKLAGIDKRVDMKGSPAMMILDMYIHILDMAEFYTWDNESEAGYIDYWKPLLRILFRDTDIKIRSGETSCMATKMDRQLNEFEHGDVTKYVSGRKIDLLVSFEVDGEYFELSSLEFKPENVAPLVESTQLNKNIRINKSILGRLANFLDDDLDNSLVIGMDFQGLIGYAYTIKTYHGAVAAVKATTDQLFLPRDHVDLDDFMEASTMIPVLLNFKSHILELVRKVNTGIRRKKRKLASMKYTRDDTPPLIDTIDIPPTFYTPKR